MHSKRESTIPLLVLTESKNISDHKTISIDDPNVIYQEKERDLRMCIKWLKLQIGKLKAAYFSPCGVSLTAIATSVAHLTYSNVVFNKAFNLLKESYLMQKVTCAEYVARYKDSTNFFNYDCSLIQKPVYIGTASHCGAIEEKICAGPGLWKGYTPVVLGVGMVLPVGALALNYIFAQRIKRFLNSSHLSKLHPYKEKTIKEIAKLHEIALTEEASVFEMLSKFEEVYQTLQENHYKHIARFSFLMASRSPDSHAHVLFKQNMMGEPQLCREIFGFAGISKN